MSVAGIPGLVQIRSSSVLITNMTIGPSNSRGVVVQLGGSIIFKKNIVDDHDKAGIVITSGGYGLIGPTSSDDHITPPNTGGLGTGTGNVISRTDIGIVVRLSAGAAIFHNAIYDNDRYGISVSAGGSADIDSNLITGHKGLPDATDPPATEEDGRGITMTTNAAVRLDEQVFHGGLDDDPSGIGNVITGNDIGLRCSLGGAINGDKPDFGGVTGNSKYGWLIFGSCAKSSSVWGGSGTQMGP